MVFKLALFGQIDLLLFIESISHHDQIEGHIDSHFGYLLSK